jgi:hypothetical protein
MSNKLEEQTTNETNTFAQQAQDKPPGLVAEFVEFLVHNKSWWLAPIIIVLLIFAGLLFFGSTAAAPFIYTIF